MTELLIDYEIKSLEEANLVQHLPLYLVNYFKDDFNQNVLHTLIKNLDHLIQSVQANNSFKILTLNETANKLGGVGTIRNNESKMNQNESTYLDKSECSLSSSLSDNTMNACKSLLTEIANRLLEIFTHYHGELFAHVKRFEVHTQKYSKLFQSDPRSSTFCTRNALLGYQKAILIEKLSSRHHNLLNILFRNVFDMYQQKSQGETEENDLDNYDQDDEKNSSGDFYSNKDYLIEKFHRINRVLFNLGLFDYLCGDVVVEVVEKKIRLYIENMSMDNYEESFIDSFENWLEKVIIGWIKLIYSTGLNTTQSSSMQHNDEFNEYMLNVNCQFDQYLLNYKKQLSHFMYTNYAHIRIKRLFDIIIDFPDSKNSIEDLKVCLSKTNLRSHVVKTLKNSIEQRLLHPGVNTSDILTAYVAAIKALLCLDPTGIMMENICEPLRKYLRNRDDTVKCIVSNLTEDCDSSNDIMEEFCKDLYSNDQGQPDIIIDSTIAAPFVYDSTKTWQMWQPDPADAVNVNNDYPGSKSNIISMLVNIYGSKDLFVNEYKTLLGDRLLSNYTFNMEKEIRNLELLKLRFGESNLFACEAMLKDISESKRINSNILEQLRQKSTERIGTFEVNSTTLKTLILSEQFWPKLKDEKIEMPPELAKIQESFMSSYETFKGNRTLIWKNNLGLVSIEIEMDDKQTLEFNVTPVQAAVIIKFQEKDTWSLQELSQSLKMCSLALRKKILFWKMQGLIKEATMEKPDANDTQDPGAQINNEIYTLVTENGKMSKCKEIEDLEEEMDKGIKVSEILKEQEIMLYWNYTASMLRGCGSLPLDRIHNWLKMYANSEITIEQVKYLVDMKTKEQLLKYSAGLYRLNK